MTDLLRILDDLLGWYHSRRTLRHYRAWKDGHA